MEGNRRDEPDTTTPMVGKQHIFCKKEKHTRGMTAKESSTSYNTKENTVITKKPTWMDQRAQEEK